MDLLRFLELEILGSMKVLVEELEDRVSLLEERFIFPVLLNNPSTDAKRSEFLRLPKEIIESSILILKFPFSWNFDIP